MILLGLLVWVSVFFSGCAWALAGRICALFGSLFIIQGLYLVDGFQCYGYCIRCTVEDSQAQ